MQISGIPQNLRLSTLTVSGPTSGKKLIVLRTTDDAAASTLFEAQDSSGNILTDILNLGVQRWNIYNPVNTALGRIEFSIPGGNVGIIFYNGGLSSNRFNIVNNSTHFQLAFNGNDQGLRIFPNGNISIGTSTDSSNGILQLATHTASTGGIGFGTDVSLYRSGAGALAMNATLATAAGVAWNLGTVNTVSPTSPNRTLTVTVAGTTYYIAAKTTND